MKAQLGLLMLSGALCYGQGTISTYTIPGTTGANGLAFDAQGNLYYSWVAEAKIIRVSPSGTVTTIAGNGKFGFAGDGGPATAATLMTPAGVAVDSSGAVYFSDSGNHVIRKISAAGIISTFAGTPQIAGLPVENVQATSSPLNQPGDLEFDSLGNLYVADNGNNRIRKITPAGLIITVAGNGNVSFSGDNGPATAAATRGPLNVAIDAQGNVYISENDARVRKVATNGVITTFAGTGIRNFSGDGGPATTAAIRNPVGIGADRFGNIYFADNGNARVRRVDAAGIITTYAGIDGTASTPLGDGGPATSAYLGAVGALTIDSNGAVYVDAVGGRIRKINPAGAGFIATPAALTFSYVTGGAAPASQAVSIASSGGVLGYTATASSTGNWLNVAAPATGNTPGTLTVLVNPVGLGAGSYLGRITLTPSGTGIAPLAIEVTLNVSGAGSPSINSGAIYNASGYQARLAPDTVFVIFGSNMGPTTIEVGSAPNYPATLAGTSVTFTPAAGGTAVSAKMVYTLAGQIAGLLPSSIIPGTYAVRVSYNGLTSAPQNVSVVARSFGIAAANGGGSGTAQATIGNVNGGVSLTRFTSGRISFNGYTWALTPAHAGDAIVLWGTGGGADPANDTGGTSGDQTALGDFKVNVGARQITPAYAGASQGYPGLWQINFVIPSDMTPDCFATVQVSAGGELSNTVVVPIAAPGQATCVDPRTPASIMSKLDAGDSINVAAFAVAKLTQTAPTTVTQETASGAVFSYTAAQWMIQNSGPSFGYCRVYDRAYAVGGIDPAAPRSSLDAGSRLPLSGPNLPPGFALGTITSTFGPVYSSSPSVGTLVSGTYSLSGMGGSAVGPFNTSTVFPSSFTVTNWDSITLINRSQPLTFNWTGSNFDEVSAVLSTAVIANGTQHLSTINCTIPGSLGTYTISTAALAYLSPVAATGASFGTFSLQAISAPGKFTANLNQGGTTDLGLFSANLGYSKNLAVQ